MSGELHEDDAREDGESQDDDYSRVAELLAYTNGESAAEADYADAIKDEYRKLSEIQESERTTYEAGYVARYRQLSDRPTIITPGAARVITEHGVMGDGVITPITRVMFDRTVTVMRDESIQSVSHMEPGGRIVVDEIYKVYPDGRRESIGFREEPSEPTRLARAIQTLRERLRQWRQLFGLSG